MGDFNLLPWREAQRTKVNKIILLASILFWILCLAVGGAIMREAGKSLADQHMRNQYLLNQNSKFEQDIAEIEALQANKQDLVERINLIQKLQAGRIQIVHVFDDIVRKLPAGVTLDRMSKRKDEIFLHGRAESNAKISELMTNFDSSQWFGKSKLTTINIDDSLNAKLSEFELAVTQITAYPDDGPMSSEQ